MTPATAVAAAVVVTHLAVVCYNRALEQQQQQPQQQRECLDRYIVRDAAYNLPLIYRMSSSDELARDLLRTCMSL